jgi:LacI family transcriptional regulator
MQKRVSIKTIAEKVGVSTALVSYVLNGKEKQARVGAEMANKIRKVAAKLHYQPNLIARGLKFGQTKTIGLIVADISNPFFSSLARIIENEAKTLGYTVIFGSSDENVDKFNDLLDSFLNRQVDGLILVPVENSAARIEAIKNRNLPFVLIDRGFKDLAANQVLIDNSDAAFNAVSLLISNGYKKVGMILYDTHLEHMKARVEGYKKALKNKGIRVNINLVKKVSYDNSQKDIEHSIDSLINDNKVDAIFFATNSIAVQSLKLINKLGIIIPKQLGVISFDESDSFEFFYSPITYVRQNIPVIGERAVKILIDNVNPNTRSSKPVIETIKTEIIVRESSGGKL